MDLTTTYLGLKLPHPFMPGAAPLADELDDVKRLEDAGAAAIVLRSLFEEQITREQLATFRHMESSAESFSEALSYFPSPERFILGPDEYLEHLRRVKGTVRCPVIGSLNGTTPGGWVHYAHLLEQAGADALELNVYALSTDMDETAQAVEDRTVQLLQEVKRCVTIPVAVKLSPFYTALPNLARRLDQAGADGLVLFNRFYQPDIDEESLTVSRSLHLSHSTELALRLRWLAILSGRVKASLAVSGGVHTAIDTVKAVMTGAHAVQMVSALLVRGPEYLRSVRQELVEWLEAHEYESLAQMQGSMSLLHSPDPAVYERANYMLILQGWKER